MAVGTGLALATTLGPPLINTIGNVISGRNNRRHSIDMWKRQNEYNLPSNQMTRLQNAGINPHLAFSSGNINNTSSSAPQTMPILPGQVNMSDALVGEQAKNLAKQRALNDAQQWLTERKTEGQLSDNQIKMVEAAIEIERFPGIFGNKNAVEEYAEELQKSNMSEFEANQVLNSFKSRMAEKNMIPGDNIIMRVLMGFMEYMGFDYSIEK